MEPASPTSAPRAGTAVADPPRTPSLLRLVAFLCVYFLFQPFAFLVPNAMGLVAAVWPAAGVALAALLLSSRRDWPALLALFFVAGIGANLTIGRPWPACVGFMVANLCETASAALLMTKWCGTTIRFRRLKDMLSLLAAATLLNVLISFIGAGTATIWSRCNFWLFYRTWWIAHGLGLLLLTPAIVVWATGWKVLLEPPRRRLIERVVLLAITIATGMLVFHPALLYLPIPIGPYVLFAMVVWSGTRFGPLATSTLVLILAPMAIGLEVMGVGRSPWGITDPASRVFSTQLFFGVLATTGMVLASGLAEQQHAQKKLRESEFRYRNLFNGMMEGFALCEMRYKDGKAVDFKYLQVNEAFQKLTGLADVAGKWVSEVIPGLRESNPGLLEVYGRVASTGKPERFEEYLATARPDRNGSGARPNAKGIFAKHIAHPHLGVGSIRATPATQGWFLRRSRNDREQTAHRRGADHVIRPRHQRAQAGR